MAIAKINNKMMFWARNYAGFVNGHEETLPKSIKSNYKSWESGEKYPTWNQLREVSRKYKVPSAYFFMRKPPALDNLPELVDYRKIDNTFTQNSTSPNLIANIRKSEVRRKRFLELAKEIDGSVPLFEKVDFDLNKDEFTRHIRNSLNISLDLQKSWFKNDSMHYNFLNNWKDVLNKEMGILIFETEGVDIGEMRALCIFHDECPIILLNGKDSVNGRIFSLFHELTHLLLGESTICDDDETAKIEIFCNSVAGEFLVPENDLICQRNLSLNSAKQLANSYGVSENVILRRLLDLGRITKEEYSENVDKYNIFKSQKSSGNYLNNMVKYNGRAYFSLLLSALELNIINTSDFMKYSNLSRSQIPKLQEKLFGV